VLEGCQEGWAVADDLGRAGAYAVITPRDRRDKSEELIAASARASRTPHPLAARRAGRDHPAARGVDLGASPVATSSRSRSRPASRFAADAAEGRARRDHVVPARLLGVDYRIGTLEVGKDCDLIVTDGRVALPDLRAASGRRRQARLQKNKETYYAQIRPRSESALAPRSASTRATVSRRKNVARRREGRKKVRREKPRREEGHKKGG